MQQAMNEQTVMPGGARAPTGPAARQDRSLIRRRRRLRSRFRPARAIARARQRSGWLASLLLLCCAAGAAVASEAPVDDIVIDDLQVTGAITGDNSTFHLAGRIAVADERRLPLVRGAVVYLPEASRLPADVRLVLVEDGYDLVVPQGTHAVDIALAAWPEPVGDGPWREVGFAIPAAKRRVLELRADRPDLEVAFPGALKQERAEVDGALVCSAMLGPGRPFRVRWKPQVADLDAELVFRTQSNPVVTISPGSLRLDDVVVVEVAQGSIDTLRFAVPPGCNIIRVAGAAIRDWRLHPVAASAEAAAAEQQQELAIYFNRPISERHALRIEAEQPLAALPTAVAVPLFRPQGALRSDGMLAVGTESAIRVQIAEAEGCSQIDASAFTVRSLAQATEDRAVPQKTVFAYTYPGNDCQLQLRLTDIVPSFDVQEQIGVRLGSDDVRSDWRLQLDIRDAPLAEVAVRIAGAVTIAQVGGQRVDVDAVQVVDDGAEQVLTVPFTEAVQGSQVIDLRLEHGASVLGEDWAVPRVSVVGARVQRGYLVLAADPGVRLADFEAAGLRQVHAASVPVALSGGQVAYRFRSADWSLRLHVEQKPSAIRAESFHLLSIGEGVCYGNAVFNYLITGAPVDRLQFRLDPRLRGVEFVGADIRRSSAADGLWTVELRRKVIGDYNLGLVYHLPLGEAPALPLGGIATVGLDGETGFAVVASRRNVRLPQLPEQPALIPVLPEELPSQYRLLVNAPIVQAWTFNQAPEPALIRPELVPEVATLGALVELVDLQTRLSLRDGGAVESRTQAMYHIKNVDQQFLRLRLPDGARPWGSVRLAIGDGEAERATVSAGADGAAENLNIQLPRSRNPNEPVTIRLEYGQSHGAVDGRTRLALQPPVVDLPSAYVHWRVRSDAGWHLAQLDADWEQAADGGRTLQVAIAPALGRAWYRSWRHLRGHWLLPAVLGVLGLLLFFQIIFARRWIPVTVCAGVALLVGLVGVGAAQVDDLSNDLQRVAAVTELDLGRALSAAEADLPHLAVQVSGLETLGGWRWASLWGLLLAGGALLVVWRGWLWRPAAVALVGSGLVWALAASPGTRPVFVHLGTWMPSLVVLVGLVLVLWGPRWRRPPAAAGLAAVACCCTLLIGCGGGRTVVQQAATAALVADAVQCDLRLLPDAVEVVLRLDLQVDEPTRLPLVGPGAVLTSDPTEAHLRVDVVTDGHQLVLERAGRYRPALTFLLPRPTIDRFELPLPAALSNRVTFTADRGGLRIDAPTAVHQLSTGDDPSAVACRLLPGQPARFQWRPRARETASEEPVVYGAIQAVHRFDQGLVQGRHQIDYRIAQGQVRRFHVLVPEDMTVTRVTGAGLGTWRFDPGSGRLEAILEEAVAESYRLTISTQLRQQSLPAAYRLRSLTIDEAESQRSTVGLVAAPAVHLAPSGAAAPLSPADFARSAAELLDDLGIDEVRYARRFADAASVVAVDVRAVAAELRSQEQAKLSISDDRLVYNAVWQIAISKAGVYQVQLALPGDYDIDHLGGDGVSHWDERQVDGRRLVTLHFPNRVQASVPLRITLSAPVGELPPHLQAPRLHLLESLKHQGRLVVQSERGVRLRVDQREGLSERHPGEVGLTDERSLVFDFLQPDWSLQLATDVVVPRIHVAALHVARVADGLVRHKQVLRWRVQHAGVKNLRVDLPPGLRPDGGLGLQVGGPDIADWRCEEVDGVWQLVVALTRKWYDKEYPLSLRYETRFTDDCQLRALGFPQADMVRRHLAVFAQDRVELALGDGVDGLLRADPRAIPVDFGAGDLSAAAYCFRFSEADYRLRLQVRRHRLADLMAADIRQATISSVITERGSVVTRVELDLVVGNKRHLSMRLPAGSRIWSATVNGRSVSPAADPQAPDRRLLPLSQGAIEEVPMEVVVVVAGLQSGVLGERLHFEVPRFDLPLQQVRWTIYTPPGYDYRDFDGTVDPDDSGDVEQVVQVGNFTDADYRDWNDTVQQQLAVKAKNWSAQGKLFSANGETYQARLALENAFNYSQVDQALNEDARVQLEQLNRQQAMVCIIGRRNALRRNPVVAGIDLGDSFSAEEAEHLAGSLQKEDYDNVQVITERLVTAQQQALAGPAQINVQLPRRGQVLQFKRSLQVDLDKALAVSFTAVPQRSADRAVVWPAWASLLAAFVAVAAGLQGLGRWWQRRSDAITITAVDDAEAEVDPDGGEAPIAPATADLLADIPGVPASSELSTSLQELQAGELFPDDEVESDDAPDDDDDEEAPDRS